MEHQYQLVITRSFDDGEEQLLDDDAESESNDDGRSTSLNHTGELVATLGNLFRPSCPADPIPLPLLPF